MHYILKKIPIIFFALFYLVITSKVTASLHLCGGTITNISLFSHSEEDACECGKKASKSCCDDIEIKCQQEINAFSAIKILKVNFTQNHFFTANIQLIDFESIKKIFFLPQTPHCIAIPPLILLQLSNIMLRI